MVYVNIQGNAYFDELLVVWCWNNMNDNKFK